MTLPRSVAHDGASILASRRFIAGAPLEPSLTDLLRAARRTLLQAREGALATVSGTGQSLASVVAYAIDEAEAPYLALHDLAAHAVNLRGDGPASLMVASTSGERAGGAARVTLVGRAHLVTGALADGARGALGAPAQHRIYRLAVERLCVEIAGCSTWIGASV